MADWAGLHPDLLVEIAKRMPLVEDFMALRGVCTSWRAAVTYDLLDGVFNSWPVVPLLMLAEAENNPDREFYSVVRRKVSMKLSLPELQGKKCMEGRFGWFLTVGSNEELELFHPFTRKRIELPPQDSFPEYDVYGCLTPFWYIKTGVLSANPSHTSDFVLMVIHGGGMFLGFWRPGDTSWTKLKPGGASVIDLNYYNGKFYAIDCICDVWVWDGSATGDLTIAERLFSLDLELEGVKGILPGQVKAYLVESAGELLVVVRDGVDLEADYGATHFQVVQLDLIRPAGWSVVTNIGDRSIFVGHNAAFSLEVIDFTGAIKSNCIYFSDDCLEVYAAAEEYNPTELGGGKDMGVYNLGDGKIERFDTVESYSFIGPPVWVAHCY